MMSSQLRICSNGFCFAFCKVVYDLSFSIAFYKGPKSLLLSDSNQENMSFRFGQHLIKPSVVFLRTELSFALVNRKPVVPGRILCFKRRKILKASEPNTPHEYRIGLQYLSER